MPAGRKTGSVLPLGPRFRLDPGFAGTQALRTDNMQSSALSEAITSGETEGRVPLPVVLTRASAELLNA